MPGSLATSSLEPDPGHSSRTTSASSSARDRLPLPHVGPAVDQLEPPPPSAAAALQAHEQVRCPTLTQHGPASWRYVMVHQCDVVT